MRVSGSCENVLFFNLQLFIIFVNFFIKARLMELVTSICYDLGDLLSSTERMWFAGITYGITHMLKNHKIIMLTEISSVNFSLSYSVCIVHKSYLDRWSIVYGMVPYLLTCTYVLHFLDVSIR